MGYPDTGQSQCESRRCNQGKKRNRPSRWPWKESRPLSRAELDRQASLGRLDVVDLVLALAAQGLLQPGRLVVVAIHVRGRWPAGGLPHRGEALVEESRVLGVVCVLLRDLGGHGVRLRDGDQLAAQGGQRRFFPHTLHTCAVRRGPTHSDVSAQMRSRASRWRRSSSGSGCGALCELLVP
jgi:hypothetical protein